MDDQPTRRVIPTSRSSFSSTIWNSPGKARRSINSAKFGGPNVAIKEGSKVQFGDGDLVWDVARVFDDGTLYLVSVSSGVRRTRKVPPGSKSWTNLWMVDGKHFTAGNQDNQVTKEKKRGGGPNRTIDPGNVVTVGNSRVRWIVVSVARDGTLTLRSYSGDNVASMQVGPKSKNWNSIYTVMG